MTGQVTEKSAKAESSDLLVKQHMPLVSQIARRYARFRPDMLEDLVQVGSIGLLKAIKYYDPDRAKTATPTILGWGAATSMTRSPPSMSNWIP